MIRRTPEEMLAQANAEESQAGRGILRIFFGYAAGVGKTYSMLEAAHQARIQGQDVVIGYVEPHARPETEALTSGLEILPALQIPYRGVNLREFDVDAALARAPEILLVDELAHSNVEGCRHEKRWQDVDELLNAGINVWTTLNVQHIESLNDVIGQITGVAVRETIPDVVFDSATELELVDITPEELLSRLQAGKVYLPDQAQRALQSFFQKGNLTALRELSLRQAAQRIHTDVETARREKAVVNPWATSDRLLVCVGPSPTTARVIRTAKRMATALDAPWVAVSVELNATTASLVTKQQISQNFRLAERLGAETIALSGSNVTDTILNYARSRNVTKIFIGKTHQSRWRRILGASVVDEILDQSGEIDIYVIHGQEERREANTFRAQARRIDKVPYVKSMILVAITTLVAFGLHGIRFTDGEANIVMVFLAGVAWTAFRLGRGPAILASVLAVLVFDFYFVPPLYTFAAADAQYLVTFIVMLTIGAAISTLTSRLQAQVESARRRERQTTALYELGKQLSSLYGRAFLLNAAGEKLAELTHGEISIYLRLLNGPVELSYGEQTSIAASPVSLPAAKWVIDHEQIAGAGTNTLPSAIALFLPLIASQQTIGAVAVRAPVADQLLEPDQRRLLEACANQLALALERDQLAIEAAEARIEAETEQVRSSLLSGVSHDLKTPLAVIAGASSSLLESHSFDEATRRQLLETVSEEANRLNRLLENILQMSKLDAGAPAPNQQWHVLEEIVGSALHRTRRELAFHPVKVQLPVDLPLLSVDGLLMEQLFVNLLENAARYTPDGTQITIRGTVDGQKIRVSVADEGPGFPKGDQERIFDKFYRATPHSDGGRGSGLGLAICRAIAAAHGGTITAHHRPAGGAEFVLLLPLQKDSPQIELDHVSP